MNLGEKREFRAEYTTIPFLGGNIKGLTLLKVAHRIVENDYFELTKGLSENGKENRTVTIEKPSDWVITLGGWKSKISRTEVQGYVLSPATTFEVASIYKRNRFILKKGRIHMPEGFKIGWFNVTWAYNKHRSRMADKTDLTYAQIFRTIEAIKKQRSVTDSRLASLQLRQLNPHKYRNVGRCFDQAIIKFLDYMNALMFGVEASSSNASLITSFMTLDLIASRKLTYEQAFKLNGDGGAYPYACFGNNKGTYSARSGFLLSESVSMKKLRANPSLSPVTLKEAMIIRMWLSVKKVIKKEHSTPEKREAAIHQAIKEAYLKAFRKG